MKLKLMFFALMTLGSCITSSAYSLSIVDIQELMAERDHAGWEASYEIWRQMNGQQKVDAVGMHLNYADVEAAVVGNGFLSTKNIFYNNFLVIPGIQLYPYSIRPVHDNVYNNVAVLGQNQLSYETLFQNIIRELHAKIPADINAANPLQHTVRRLDAFLFYFQRYISNENNEKKVDFIKEFLGEFCFLPSENNIHPQFIYPEFKTPGRLTQERNRGILVIMSFAQKNTFIENLTIDMFDAIHIGNLPQLQALEKRLYHLIRRPFLRAPKNLLSEYVLKHIANASRQLRLSAGAQENMKKAILLGSTIEEIKKYHLGKISALPDKIFREFYTSKRNLSPQTIQELECLQFFDFEMIKQDDREAITGHCQTILKDKKDGIINLQEMIRELMYETAVAKLNGRLLGFVNPLPQKDHLIAFVTRFVETYRMSDLQRGALLAVVNRDEFQQTEIYQLEIRPADIAVPLRNRLSVAAGPEENGGLAAE